MVRQCRLTLNTMRVRKFLSPLYSRQLTLHEFSDPEKVTEILARLSAKAVD